MAKLEPFRGDYYLWKYLPSIPAAVVFLVLFLVATSAIVWRIWKTRSWFCTAFAIGGLFQVIGYATRIVSHNNTAKLMPFAIQNAFILLAPVLYAASIYMTLGRVIRSVQGEAYSIISARWLTRIFVTGDVMALMIQSGASGLMVMDSMAHIGEGVIIGGLAFHIIIFGVFFSTAAVFHRRMLRYKQSIPHGIPWQQMLGMLYGVSALIMARSIFRIIEFIMGHDGYLLSNEWPLLVFDSIPMLAVMVIFWKWFPSVAPGNASSGSSGSSGEPMDVMPSRGDTTMSAEESWGPKQGYR